MGKLYYESGGVTLYHGDVLQVLRELPDESVNCCITSPPYYSLRDYGTARWSGGLPDCDHTSNHGKQGATGQRADRTFTARAVYKDECRRCGAKRIDQQIGLEETPDLYIDYAERHGGQNVIHFQRHPARKKKLTFEEYMRRHAF